jgi:hypothetical protein
VRRVIAGCEQNISKGGRVQRILQPRQQALMWRLELATAALLYHLLL